MEAGSAAQQRAGHAAHVLTTSSCGRNQLDSSAPHPPKSAGMKLLPTQSSGATLSTLNPAHFFTLRFSIASAICTQGRAAG
jgi:hypothetical protein